MEAPRGTGRANKVFYEQLTWLDFRLYNSLGWER
jgi:hypothetical protein